MSPRPAPAPTRTHYPARPSRRLTLATEAVVVTVAAAVVFAVAFCTAILTLA